jgi:hypothetical protein
MLVFLNVLPSVVGRAKECEMLYLISWKRISG